MLDPQSVVDHIRSAFQATQYPGDPFLQGSFDGCEPYDELSPFVGKADWALLEPEFLDARYVALSFFSEGAFRFFLPAYLVADVQDRLNTADPVFHLTHGLAPDQPFQTRLGDQTFDRSYGRSVLLGPVRYGAMTTEDYARYRLSVFTREEAGAIVTYLRFSQQRDRFADGAIQAALDGFWLDRAQNAPTAESLMRHLEREREYYEALRSHRAPPE